MTHNYFLAMAVLTIAAVVAAAVVASPAPTTVTTKELVLFSPPQNITSYALSSGRISSDVTIPDIGPQGAMLWAAVIQGGFQFSAAVCAAALVSTGPAGATVCAIAVATTCIASAVSIYYNGNAKRSTDIDWFADIDPSFAPTLDCGTACQLESRSPHNTWTAFANVTTNGINHTVSYFQNGKVRGLRAVQHGTGVPVLDSRQIVITEEIVDGDTATGTQNWAGTLYWEDGAEIAWDNWSAETDAMGSALGDFMVDNEAEVACMDASDVYGGALASVFLIDFTGGEVTFSDDTGVEDAITECIDIMPVADQKKRLESQGGFYTLGSKFEYDEDLRRWGSHHVREEANTEEAINGAGVQIDYSVHVALPRLEAFPSTAGHSYCQARAGDHLPCWDVTDTIRFIALVLEYLIVLYFL
ncbi:hypothetical protein BX600DRAFT_540178 [Xylariales sp. PMI_506]|nr:hypothetical protein BX600DRAFT_540178 [Xylariales sp. PMI_506]